MKNIVIYTIVLVVIGTLLYWWFFNKGLPYGRLNPKSDLCQKPELFQNRELCIRSGCNWGSGDITGPPFCGAYK